MRLFPIFGERTVKIKGGNGKEYDIDKISADEADIVMQIAQNVKEQIADAKDDGDKITDAMVAGKKKLMEIAKPKLPQEIQGDLFRLGYFELSDFCLYLIYGTELNENKSQPKNSEKKTASPSPTSS